MVAAVTELWQSRNGQVPQIIPELTNHRRITVTKPRILVTSAAGRNASAAVLDLLGKGFPVRAFVRRQDARSEKLKQAGAEIFVGDLFDLSDLRRALVDVQRAYHSPPVAPTFSME